MGEVLQEILSEIKGVKSDVGDLKAGQARLESRFEGLETDVADLKTDVADLKTGQTRLETRIDSVEKGQARLETRIESEVIDKLRILFDAFQSHEDRLDCHEQRLDRLESKVDGISADTRFLVAQVAKLQELAK